MWEIEIRSTLSAPDPSSLVEGLGFGLTSPALLLKVQGWGRAFLVKDQIFSLRIEGSGLGVQGWVVWVKVRKQSDHVLGMHVQPARVPP